MPILIKQSSIIWSSHEEDSVDQEKQRSSNKSQYMKQVKL